MKTLEEIAAAYAEQQIQDYLEEESMNNSSESGIQNSDPAFSTTGKELEELYQLIYNIKLQSLKQNRDY